MPNTIPTRLFLLVLFTVWACSFLIGSALAGSNPLLTVLAGRIMEEVDANGDNKVTRGEFAEARGVRFLAADRDGDGYVTRQEFMQELEAMTGQLGLVWGDQMFNVLDKDADNLLARDEVDQLGETAFTAADHNGDGIVTPAEVHPSLAMAQ